MKLLVAIESTDYKNLPDRSLRWCGRSGFDVRVFVPKNKRRRFRDVVNEVNYQWYLALPQDTIVSRYTPVEYAKRNHVDLMLTVPENLISWKKGKEYSEEEIVLMREAVGKARLEFGQKPRKQIKRFRNGCTIRRVDRS